MELTLDRSFLDFEGAPRRVETRRLDPCLLYLHVEENSVHSNFCSDSQFNHFGDRAGPVHSGTSLQEFQCDIRRVWHYHGLPKNLEGVDWTCFDLQGAL